MSRYLMPARDGAQQSFGIRRQRGVALIMVLGLLALVGTVVADFQYTSRVDLQLAFNARDELQAEYNALSAMRFRALILKQARKVQTLVQAMMGGLGGNAAAPPIGSILELIPVECGLMSAITKKSGRAADLDAKDTQEGEFFPGECLATSVSEHSKIAINLLGNDINQRSQQVAMILLGLLSDPRLRKHFEEDDRTGSHAESPLALVNAIVDWVDPDHSEQGNLGDEDRHYAYLKDSYRAKNAPFDSVAELQLVHGIDDGLYNLLKDRVSIYVTDPAIELATAPLELIVFWGLPAILRDGVPVDALLPFIPPITQQLALAKQVGFGFSTITVQLLRTMLDTAGLSPYYDPNKLQRIFSDRSSTTWYTIMAEGRMGRSVRKIRTVFQATEGTFYYARVE